MKKQILGGILACSMLLGNASAAFTDITSADVRQAAGVLDALDIMQGMGNSRFQPSAALTRAQFSKLAVTSLGLDDVSAYKGYTIFPDLPSTHWAAAYINATMKDSSVSQKQIIRGFADGTFRPDRAITYGEACTMLLRMLGYGVSDVGAFWPNDYILKAQSLGICDRVKEYGANETINRGDAAIMLLNALQAKPKDGNKLLYQSVDETMIENSILLATSDTDSDLVSGQAQFYENGSIITRRTTKLPDQSLIGQRGTVLFDKENSSKVCAFLPDTDDTGVFTVHQTTLTSMEAVDGAKYKIASDTPVVIGEEILVYAKSYFDLNNRSVRVYYDADGKIELIVKQVVESGNTFVYGTATAAHIQSHYQILKNGQEIAENQIKKYDVVTLDTQKKCAYVSDDRITGYLRDASPAYTNPSTVTVFGQKFSVSEQGAAYFAKMKYLDKVTLLLDDNGIVCAAYPQGEVSADMLGQYVEQNGSVAKVRLLNGVTVSGVPTEEVAKLQLGRLVTVSEQKTGYVSFGEYKFGDVTSHAWDLTTNKIGTKRVSDTVKVFEVLSNTAPVSEIQRSDLEGTLIPAKSIRAMRYDQSGTITAVFLSDYTGEGWQYGMAQPSSSVDDGQSVSTTVLFRTFVDGESVVQNYTAMEFETSKMSGVVGLPKGGANITGTLEYIPVKTLDVAGTVSRDAFDSDVGVRTNAGYYKLADDIGVYVADYDKMLSLREAKTVCTQFVLYVDSDTAQGAKIRVIIGK